MRPLAALVILFLAAVSPLARAQSMPDDQYVVIYGLIQQADAFDHASQPRQALAEFVQAQGALQKFQKIFPEWNPTIVNFRLKYLAGKIAGLTAQFPATNAPASAASTPATTNGSSPVAPAGFEVQLNTLRAQVQSLQADNITLGAKLKEALAAQPATIDARGLARAQEQVRSLMKENDLLKVSLASNYGGMSAVDAAALARSQQALAEAGEKLRQQTELAIRLAADNQSLQAKMQALLASPEAAEALRAENALLKRQLAEMKPAPGSVAPAPPSQAENEARIRELTQERDDLLAKLGAANKELYGRNKAGAGAQISELNDQVRTLRARLAVDEAQAVPYTPEELALFQQPAPSLAGPDARKKSISELPAGAAELVAEAQNYFSARQYDKAGEDYLKILQRDENNPLALANLAAIEMEQGRLDDAEKHLQAALAQKPDDAYNLATFGYLKFRQEKYDDALNALSKAAKLDPQNPEIQNYLGVTLGHKGLRAPAETALRKAIQLDPNYAAAHNNLAVIYINQQPPLVQLARWHYQKALDGGQPPNPDLEKMLAEKGAAVERP